MTTINDYLAADHIRCDAIFEMLENKVEKKLWESATVDLDQFNHALSLHFSMEENVLFPAFEKATGNSNGPTSVMRLDHQQLRGIVSRLAESLVLRDTQDFFDHADTLRIMLQQHNLKEESILYMMADRVLSGDQAQIINDMHTIAHSNAFRMLPLTE